MTEAKMAQKSPYVIDEQPGKKLWCSCGHSAKQPYCDGSHSGTDFFPEITHVDVAKKIAWCGCKKTKNPPYCDGTHSKLP
jgi:CDGSH-type Zn-finger protein